MLAFGALQGDQVAVIFERKTGVAFKQSAFYTSMRDNGELLHDVKPFALTLCASQEDRYAKYIPSGPIRTCLSRDVQREVARAITYKPLRSTLVAHLKEGRIPSSPGELDERIEDAMNTEDFKTYVRKFVIRKLRFLFSSLDEQFGIESELRRHAYYNLLRTYPAWNDQGHMIAIAKNGARNRGHNIIKEQTAQCRSHLHTNSDGTCSASTVSWDLVREGIDAGTRSVYNLSCGLDGRTTPQDVFDSIFSLNELMASPELTRLQKHYLQLAAGQYDAQFTDWLGCESNAIQAQDLPFEAYNEQIRSYLNLTPEMTEKFLSSLRTLL